MARAATKPEKASAEEAPVEEAKDFKDLDDKDAAAAFSVLERVKGKELQLHAKLADIMLIAERIPKRGTADRQMGGYRFVLVGDAADFIRRALGRRRVSMTPTKTEVVGRHDHATKAGGVMTILDLTVVWTLTDADTGESTTIATFGAGGDTGDKYSGKAMTSNMKYAMLAGFQLSTGEDSELSDASDRVAAPSERPQGPNTTANRPPPQHGGRQQAQTQPQEKVIGELMRSLGAVTTDKAIALLQELTGKTIAVGDDKATSLKGFLSDTLTPNERGKLIHDLRKRVETKDKPEGQQAEEQVEGGVSSPGAPVGEAPDESLEAGPEA